MGFNFDSSHIARENCSVTFSFNECCSTSLPEDHLDFLKSLANFKKLKVRIRDWLEFPGLAQRKGNKGRRFSELLVASGTALRQTLGAFDLHYGEDPDTLYLEFRPRASEQNTVSIRALASE